MLVLSSACEMVLLAPRMGLSFLVKLFWKHPHRYPEVCLLGNSKCSQIDNKG